MTLHLGQGSAAAELARIACGLLVVAVTAAAAGCGVQATAFENKPGAATLSPRSAASLRHPRGDARYAIPPLLDRHDVYAADRALSRTVRHFRALVYVPNSAADTVDEIDQHTFRIVRSFHVGAVPQHVVPSYDLHTLWVTNDIGNSLTAINPATGAPGRTVHVEDPYNMYFTPDGRYAMVMAETMRRIDFRDAHTMHLHHSLAVPMCAGVNHADFTANGREMLVSCEYGAAMVVVDVPSERVIHTVRLPPRAAPQDVKLSPNGHTFYVADLTYGGVWKIDGRTFRRTGFVKTGGGAHGLYPGRDARRLYVSNRSAGSVSVISFATGRVVATWPVPGGSPDMGGVSASGSVLWLTGRYNSELYAIDTRSGKLIQRIPVGLGPHGACVYPQPGRYSLGHTGVMR